MGFAAALEGPHFVGPDATFRRAVVGFTQVDGGKCGFLAGLAPKNNNCRDIITWFWICVKCIYVAEFCIWYDETNTIPFV